MTEPLRFFCVGKPQPKGSTRSFRHPHTGALVTKGDCKGTKPWQHAIAATALEAGAEVREGPVDVELRFWLARPKGHSGKRGLLPSAPVWPGVKPDIDKLARAALDGLKGIAYRDDAQVVRLSASKHYCSESQPHEGVRVIVREAGE